MFIFYARFGYSSRKDRASPSMRGCMNWPVTESYIEAVAQHFGIWDLYEKRRFLPYAAYLPGWSRTSCLGCIFSNADLYAMMREIAPERFQRLVEMEKELNHTIDTNRVPLEQKANLGSLDRLPKEHRLSGWVKLALSRSFNMMI